MTFGFCIPRLNSETGLTQRGSSIIKSPIIGQRKTVRGPMLQGASPHFPWLAMNIFDLSIVHLGELGAWRGPWVRLYQNESWQSRLDGLNAVPQSLAKVKINYESHFQP
jgi:hypothetical protein